VSGRFGRAVAVVNTLLAAIMVVLGTLGVASSTLLGWVWVLFGFIFTALAFGWLRAMRVERPPVL
jgi:hypothetical protein